MKKMNKIVASLLVGSMVFSLAACSNNNQQPNQGTTPTSSTPAGTGDSATTPAEIVKPDSIKVMWDGTIFKEGDNYAEAFYSAMEEKTGIKIQWIRPDHSTYSEQVGIAFTDMNTIADVILLPATHYASYAAQGNLWNMTDAWNNSDTAKSGRLIAAADQNISNWTVKGPDGQEGIYGMYPARGNGCVTYVKAAWAKKAGYDSADKLPADWESYQKFLLDMKEKNGKAPLLAAGGPAKLNEAPYTNYLPEFWQDAYPGFYQDASGKWVDGFSEEATVKALDRIRWGMENGVMEATMLENPSTADVRNKFYDDTTGIFTYWAGTWAYTIKSNLQKKDLDSECWVLKPIKELGAYYERLSPMIAITANCKNPEGVFKYFIDPMLDGADMQMMWMYGVEGVHYEWDADHKTIKGLPTEASKGTEKEAMTTKNLFEANLKLATFSGVDPYVPQDVVIDECFEIFDKNCKPAPKINSSDVFISYDAELTKTKEELCAKVAKGELTGAQAIEQYNKDCGAIVTAILDSFNNPQ